MFCFLMGCQHEFILKLPFTKPNLSEAVVIDAPAENKVAFIKDGFPFPRHLIAWMVGVIGSQKIPLSSRRNNRYL